MNIARRTLILGASASLLPSAASAQSLRFSDAAAYSAQRRGVSLLVRRGRDVLFEDYPDAGEAGRGWELASGTKSFTGVMAAAAVQDGLLTLDEPAADTLSEWRGDAQKRRITIRHLLSLTCGLRSDGIGRAPTYADAIQLPAIHPPGQHFEYGPGPFQVFGEILRRKLTRDADPVAYLQRRVFDPLRIAPSDWRRGRDRMPLLPQGAHFTARAWAEFGAFVHEGGRGLVDLGALNACFEPSRTNPGYGLSWWLLRPGLVPPGAGAGVTVNAADAARLGDVRMAAGAGDQRLYILPDRNLVIVRQANRILRGLRARGEDRWNDADFLSLLLSA